MSPTRKPIHYRFISIDEECINDASPAEETTTTTGDNNNNDTIIVDDPQCFSLLSQFYQELMIPTFPLEEERDDINDWYDCFRSQIKLRKHLLHVKEQEEIRGVLMHGLGKIGCGEVGVAKMVQRMANTNDNGDGDEEEECYFDGPAMDVILMIRDDKDFDNNEEDDGQYFVKRSRSSLLRSQSSMYGGLYTPDNEMDGDNIALPLPDTTEDVNELLQRRRSAASNRSSLLSRQSSLYGGLYTPSTSIDEHKHEEYDDLEPATLLAASERDAELSNNQHQSNQEISKKKKKYTIIGGAAIEYYKQSRVGLLSYVVLHREYRGCGLAKYLHLEALRRMEMLAASYAIDATLPTPHLKQDGSRVQNNKPVLQAIFAETNTPNAGDITPEQSLLRHKSLYNLGYRLVHFPYAQPPLSTENVDGSFDDIVLLVYFPFDDVSDMELQLQLQMALDKRNDGSVDAIMSKNGSGNHDDALEEANKLKNENENVIKRFCPWFVENINKKECRSDINTQNDSNTVQMDINIPFQYVEDFYQSVFGYDNIDNNEVEEIEGDVNLNDRTSNEATADGASSENGSIEGIPDYHQARYYQLAHWFCHNRKQQHHQNKYQHDNNNNDIDPKRAVNVSLSKPSASRPWEDSKEHLYVEWKEWLETKAPATQAE